MKKLIVVLVVMLSSCVQIEKTECINEHLYHWDEGVLTLMADSEGAIDCTGGSELKYTGTAAFPRDPEGNIIEHIYPFCLLTKADYTGDMSQLGQCVAAVRPVEDWSRLCIYCLNTDYKQECIETVQNGIDHPNDETLYFCD